MELRTKELVKTYGTVRAVNGMSLAFTAGVCGLLGPNGSGKTTLMRLLCGLVKPTGGSVFFNDKKVTHKSMEYREQLGYMPQDLGFYPDITGEAFLSYIAALKGIRESETKKLVTQYLDLTGLLDVRNRKIRTYSGGMKRRLGIAQALINNPSVLILDEPTAGLDPKERVRFRNLISQIALNRIVIISTHIVSDLDSIAERIIMIRSGSIIADAKPEKLLGERGNFAWSVEIPEKDLTSFESRFLIANIKGDSGRLRLRILSDEQPHADAVPETPTLEDLYLWNYYDLLDKETSNGGEGYAEINSK